MRYILSDCANASKPLGLKIGGYYSQFWNRYDMDYHRHERVEIMYIVSGSCSVLFIDDKNPDPKDPDEVVLKQGEVILIDAYSWHRLTVSGAPAHIVNLEFMFTTDGQNPCSLTELVKNSAVFKNFVVNFSRYEVIIDDGELYVLIKIILQELAASDKKADDELILAHYCALLLLLFARQGQRVNLKASYMKHVKNSILYINRNYNTQMKVQDIADHAGTSYSYLEKVFKSVMNISLVNYIASLRIDRAIFFLENTNDPIESVAKKVGFCTRQQFNNAMKKFKGVSAQEYRNKKNGPDVWRGFNKQYDFEELPDLK